LQARYAIHVVMESLMALSGLVEAIVAIWGAALYCGSGVCYSSRSMASI